MTQSPPVYLVTGGRFNTAVHLFGTLQLAREAVLEECQNTSTTTIPDTVDDLQPWFHNSEEENSPAYTCEYPWEDETYAIQAAVIGGGYRPVQDHELGRAIREAFGEAAARVEIVVDRDEDRLPPTFSDVQVYDQDGTHLPLSYAWLRANTQERVLDADDLLVPLSSEADYLQAVSTPEASKKLNNEVIYIQEEGPFLALIRALAARPVWPKDGARVSVDLI